MPDLGDLTYLAEYWLECGRVSNTGFGCSPLLWSELKAFAEINGLAKWECKIIHFMSRMFVKSKDMFDDKMCECPYRYQDKPMLELQLLATMNK